MPLGLRDVLDRGFILILSGGLAWRMINDVVENGHIYNLLIVVSELFVVTLALLAKPAKQMSTRTSDWLIGLAGTSAPLLVMPAHAPLSFVSPAVFMGFMLFGIQLQLVAKASLLRSFGLVAANRGIATRGLYRFIRHPIYLSYFVAHLGFLGLNPSLWNAFVLVCCWSFQLVRINAEERLLSADPTYTAYRERVRWRLLPGVY
jgi:protein-S-isoprenylcysteine O-methyltransferase Ste14